MPEYVGNPGTRRRMCALAAIAWGVLVALGGCGSAQPPPLSTGLAAQLGEEARYKLEGKKKVLLDRRERVQILRQARAKQGQ
jgi:hypothetical protein